MLIAPQQDDQPHLDDHQVSSATSSASSLDRASTGSASSSSGLTISDHLVSFSFVQKYFVILESDSHHTVTTVFKENGCLAAILFATQPSKFTTFLMIFLDFSDYPDFQHPLPPIATPISQFLHSLDQISKYFRFVTTLKFLRSAFSQFLKLSTYPTPHHPPLASSRSRDGEPHQT